jgi:hypothetical protein
MVKTIINMLNNSYNPFVILKELNFDLSNTIEYMRFIPILITLILFLGSCNEDFDVTKEWKDIPIVYGILSAQDTVHYIRLEKAFLDPKKNAIELAKIPDSLYYKNATVKIQDMSDSRIYNLQKVDGNLEGKPKEEGVFAQSPNTLYKISANELQIQPNQSYRLIIERDDNKPIITATTRIIPNFNIFQPLMAGGNMRIVYDNTVRIVWEKKPEIQVVDVLMDFHYFETPKGQPNLKDPKTITWQIQSRVSSDRISFVGEQFYRVLADRMKADPTVDRYFSHIDIKIIGVGDELYNYIKVFIANSGITGTQEIPKYTNLSDGFGIFSSRNYMKKGDMILTPESLFLLRTGEFTSHLGFK